MSKKDQVEKNLTLSFDFIRRVIKDPSIIESVEDQSELVFTGKESIPVFKKRPKVSLQKKSYSKNKSATLKK